MTDPRLECSFEQLFLGSRVVIDGGNVCPRFGCNCAGGKAMDSVLLDGFDGYKEYLLFG
jgi:hypothetical protein